MVFDCCSQGFFDACIYLAAHSSAIKEVRTFPYHIYRFCKGTHSIHAYSWGAAALAYVVVLTIWACIQEPCGTDYRSVIYPTPLQACIFEQFPMVTPVRNSICMMDKPLECRWFSRQDHGVTCNHKGIPEIGK